MIQGTVQAPKLTEEEKIQAISSAWIQILEALELDISDPSLCRTPQRIAETYVKELFSGLDPATFPEILLLENTCLAREEGMILIDNISVKSICEHHFLPFTGKAKVAYVPKSTLLGLSKINRIVHYFCRRPQLQERLGAQIADALSDLLGTDDVAVAIEAEHFCVTMRGVRDAQSLTHTCLLRGQFQTSDSLRTQFLLKK